MILTYTTKKAIMEHGYFTTGSGPTTILLMGSCRCIPHINYLHDFNELTGNRFTIHFIDPFDWHWNERDELIDYEAKILSLEQDTRITNMLKRVDIFIHEYYENAGMFNVSREREKNIYQFGMNPKHDLCIPNFHNISLLTTEIVKGDAGVREAARKDFLEHGSLTQLTLDIIDAIQCSNLQKFRHICSMTSFPEMSDYFEQNFKKVRMFWTSNHIARAFSTYIFEQLVRNLWGEEITPEVRARMQHDIFENGHKFLLCEYDHGYEWNEARLQLRSIL